MFQDQDVAGVTGHVLPPPPHLCDGARLCHICQSFTASASSHTCSHYWSRGRLRWRSSKTTHAPQSPGVTTSRVIRRPCDYDPCAVQTTLVTRFQPRRAASVLGWRGQRRDPRFRSSGRWSRTDPGKCLCIGALLAPPSPIMRSHWKMEKSSCFSKNI